MISIADPNIKSGITLFDNVFKDIDFSFFGGTDKVEKLKNLILFDKSCIKRRQEVFSDILENEGLIAFFDKLCEKLDAIEDMASSRKNAALYSSNEGLLYSFRELGLYTECIETIINAGEIFKEKVKSEWLIELFEYATKIRNAAVTDECLYGYYENPKGALKSIDGAAEFDTRRFSEWEALKKAAGMLKKFPEYKKADGAAMYYRFLVAAHNLYYHAKDAGLSGEYEEKVLSEMEKVLSDSKRKIIANKYINAKWKAKLLAGKR